jgi:undecaprenyl-diphosphatase
VGRHARDIEQLSPRDGVLIGLAQSLSLIPGVSRSGATMSAGLLLGLERPAAARFAFLLAVPAVVASGLFELKDVITGDEHSTTPIGYVLIATLVAFVVGYAAIAWFLRYLAHHSVKVFVIYRLLVGSSVLLLLAAGAIS